MDEASQEFDPYATNTIMGKKDSKGIYFSDKLKAIWDVIKYYGVRILPYIQKIMITIIFYSVKIFKSALRIALEQLRFK